MTFWLKFITKQLIITNTNFDIERSKGFFKNKNKNNCVFSATLLTDLTLADVFFFLTINSTLKGLGQQFQMNEEIKEKL